MSSSTPSPAVLAWRDHDAQARSLPGMSLGRVPLAADPGAAERLWAMGARRAELDSPVDLVTPGPGAARAAIDRLCLVRDLTARAVQVDWDLRLPPGRAEQTWKVLSHLQPPHTVTGPADAGTALHAWRTRHYLCKLVWRQGPGFLQIRDRRWGDLRRFTADDPRYPEAVARLDRGARHSDIAADILAELTAEHLVLRADDLVWWLPYRVTRWLQEAMAV
ncbi:hypothetical protein GCM10010503_42260 [Streptomyces lucensis JCM 4490]|uniref:Uncharacterized protein n=1 Tax=Streptomyces lucensis JCM 4490 TaxID=1306176 RepID=A0A918JC42_9ACTN|nr:DUF5825 family protein [Streptomyces lucensis]GGW60461.1 hypothetical protein GCM10010503_42260 [Streptomyces lucensis JCM 4490]